MRTWFEQEELVDFADEVRFEASVPGRYRFAGVGRSSRVGVSWAILRRTVYRGFHHLLRARLLYYESINLIAIRRCLHQLLLHANSRKYKLASFA